MGYLKIPNLYKDQSILMFRRCFAMEKIHGTSANIGWKDWNLTLFSGGETHQRFVDIFDDVQLAERFRENFGNATVRVHGEAYGGKQQGMRDTYGTELRFVAFDVRVGETWVSVPNAADICQKLGLEFVDYEEIDATVEAIDRQRDRFSVQAVRNGVGADKLREGVVLRPLVEMQKGDGSRVISKHKGEQFSERVHAPKVKPDQLEVVRDANLVAEEWVVPMRLTHVLDKLVGAGEIGQVYDVTDTKEVICGVIEDVMVEAAGEIEDTKAVRRAIGKRAAKLYIQMFKNALITNNG